MWHQSLQLSPEHGDDFQSMIDEVEPSPASNAPSARRPSQQSVSNQSVAVEQGVPQQAPTNVYPSDNTAESILQLNESRETQAAKPQQPSVNRPVTRAKSVAHESLRLDVSHKPQPPTQRSWGQLVDGSDASTAESHLKTSLLHDSGESSIDLLVLQWLNHDPAERAFVQSFTSNCLSSLKPLGFESCLALGFSTTGAHQTDPRSTHSAEMLALIPKTVQERQVKAILLTGSALASSLLQSQSLVCQLRDTVFYHETTERPTVVSVDFRTLAAAPKLKRLLWQDLKRLANTV